jgi:hypothetical protein
VWGEREGFGLGGCTFATAGLRSGFIGLCVLLSGLPVHVLADAQSLGPQGIAAANLGLTGAGVAIGQVEQGRPGSPGYDDDALTNSGVVPGAVFRQTTPVLPNVDIDEHATEVASVLISTDPAAPGVAPHATLYASAFELLNQTTALSAMQHVAQQAGGTVRAINMSFGLSGTPNSSSLLSRGTDWLAAQQDVLLVNSGLQDDLANYIPKDAFNNIVVGRLSSDGNGEFNRVSVENRVLSLAGGRTRPDILAPGDGIVVAASGNDYSIVSGTSFAAPHVTGTAALLHEFIDQQIGQGQPRMTPAARRHEVVKAVLLNSADKLADAGDGLRLGMQKTIVDSQGHDWTQSAAFTSLEIPLDDELGVGALNAARAIEQLAGGQWGPGSNIAAVGWDYNRTLTAGDFRRYAFADSLVGGSYLSATLTWDRTVLLSDTNANQQFDPGESFFDLGLTNLDLYLMPKGAQDLSEMIWGSTADSSWNIEHLFFLVPQTGDYELWVSQRDVVVGQQFYALAWQAVMVPEPATLLPVVLGAVLVTLAYRKRSSR